MKYFKHIINILLILIAWYLIIFLFEVDLNPLRWSYSDKETFAWCAGISVLLYGVISVKPFNSK